MPPDHGQRAGAGLGGSLRRAWLGYQRRLDDEMAALGFGERAFPNGRVLRFCRANQNTTTAQIGRELRVTRQRASQIVANLNREGYVTITASATSDKEKVVSVTPQALEYLSAHGKAARRIERSLEEELGQDSLTALRRLCEHLADADDIRMSDYLRQKRRGGALRYPEE